MKGIAVLAMLLIMPSVFALLETEIHKVTLISRVGFQPASFRLIYDQVLSEMVQTNPSDAVFTDGGEYKGGTVSVRNLSESAVDVVFRAVISNDAKEIRRYELVFSAGPFAAMAGGEPLDVEPDTVYTALSLSDGCDGARVSESDEEEEAVTKPSDRRFRMVVTLNGATCDAGTEVARFRVHYNRDERIDPTETGYSATVKMEIHTL